MLFSWSLSSIIRNGMALSFALSCPPTNRFLFISKLSIGYAALFHCQKFFECGFILHLWKLDFCFNPSGDILCAVAFIFFLSSIDKTLNSVKEVAFRERRGVVAGKHADSLECSLCCFSWVEFTFYFEAISLLPFLLLVSSLERLSKRYEFSW